MQPETKFYSIRDQIEQAKSQLNPTVTLVAVSKTKPIDDIMSLYQLGQRHFGENYLQESINKINNLPKDIIWHFIGPIQANKSKTIAENFSWAQTIDRIKIARRLNEQRPANLAPLNICIQVNINNEPQKHGITTDNINQLAKEIASLKNLQLRGLMAIPKANQPQDLLIKTFTNLNKIYQQLQQHYSNIDTLSMGMSQDFISAIQHGSTMVRIGSALFGPRD